MQSHSATQSFEARNAAPGLHILNVTLMLAILIMLIKIVPDISTLLTDNGKTLSPILSFLAKMSDLVRQYWWGFLAAIGVLYAAGPLKNLLTGKMTTKHAATTLGVLILAASTVAYALIQPLFEIGRV